MTSVASSSRPTRRGYDKKQVAAFLDAAGIRLAAMESTDRPGRPLVSGAILARWAKWADPTRFLTRRLREGYDTAEVDAFLDQGTEAVCDASDRQAGDMIDGAHRSSALSCSQAVSSSVDAVNLAD